MHRHWPAPALREPRRSNFNGSTTFVVVNCLKLAAVGPRGT